MASTTLSDPPLKGIRVLEFAGLAPGTLSRTLHYAIASND
jgi:hypothetical protein